LEILGEMMRFKNSINIITTLSAITATLLFNGCSQEKKSTLQDSLKSGSVKEKTSGYALFNPTTGTLPFPNNLLFSANSSGTNDADELTLNIPYETNASDADIKKSLNALTGFSTVAPISAPISTMTIDTNSFNENSVQLYKVTTTSGAVTSINTALRYNIDYTALQSGDNIVIQPLNPLDSASTYMVVLTDSIVDTDGAALIPDPINALTLSALEIKVSSSINTSTAAALNGVRLANQAMKQALVTYGKNPSNSVAMWNFTTQTLGTVLKSIYDATTAQTMTLVNTETNSTLNAATIYSGTLNVPYYLEAPSSTNPTANLSGYFKDSNGKSIISGVPVQNSLQNIPVLLSTPKTAMPAAGWPLVIFQHGVTANRLHLYSVADSFALAGYMVVAIDLPLHGITPTSTAASLRCSAPCVERTFDVDFVTEVNETVTAIAPDTIKDSSGAHFMNLQSLLTTRDNGRQASSDLMTLHKSLATANFLTKAFAAETTKIDTTNVHYVGHSMGSMTGFGFLANESSVKTVTLLNSGSNWAGMLMGSQKYGPTLIKGLAAVGIEQGSDSFNSFLIAMQTVLESSDPVSYASTVATNHKVYLTKVANDNSVPNNVLPTFPFTGTEGLVGLMGATTIDTNGTLTDSLYSVNDKDVVLNFTKGVHTTILRPIDVDDSNYTDVFTVMQESMVSFVTSDATTLKISDVNVTQ
jgi:dienelactone hydrolase